MKLLIIGGGIYVQGSDYNENGTIIPSVIESIKDKNIDQVCFVTTSNYSAKECVKKSKRLAKFLKVKNLKLFKLQIKLKHILQKVLKSSNQMLQ